MNIKGYIVQVVFLILSVVITIFIVHRTEQKVAVVDAVKLFNEFKMKNELEQKAAGRLKYLSTHIDSLQKVLQQTKNDDKQYKVLVSDLQGRSRQLEEEYNQSNQLINEMTWKRLNPLIDDYCKAQNYRLVVGANGMGSVLYYNDYYDATDDLVKYVNSKYEGE